MQWLLGLIVGLSVVLPSITSAQSVPLKPEWRVVLPETMAATVARQCSRRSPEPIDGAWTPTSTQLDTMEAQLPGVFEKNLHALLGDPKFGTNYNARPLSAYRRQYIGLILKGRRIIYLNAVALSANSSKIDWRKRPVMVCDGGTITFGVEYDPARKVFMNFAFNGAI